MRPSQARRRWTTAWWSAVVVGALVLAAGSPAVSRPAGSDPRKEREEVRRKQAEVAAEVDTLKATGAEVDKALDVLAANVAAQGLALEDARRAATAAEEAAIAAKAAQEQAEAELEALGAQLQALAVAAYIDPTQQSTGVDILHAASFSEGVTKKALIGLRAGGNLDLTDRMDAAREDLTLQRERADNALAEARIRTDAVAAQLAAVEAAKAQEEQVAASLDARLNTALSEAANLASLDKQLADQIAAEEAARAARASRSGGSGARFTRGSVSLTTVRGITVASSIADNVEGLLAAAEADGITLRGGGYRDPEEQIALRRAHCGTSDYAVYEMPSSQCRPPTAPPGYSMHEQGLAIDFTYNGSVIQSRSNPAYKWLSANAGRFGLYNLPSEPWHWSTNGN